MVTTPAFRVHARSLDDRRRDVQRIESVSGGIFKVTGLIDVEGAGEGVVAVPFPIRFIEEPGFSYGPRMGAYAPLTPGDYPTCSVVVLRYDIDVRPDVGETLYDGAEFIVVVGGPSDQVMVVQWHMEGRALVNPAR